MKTNYAWISLACCVDNKLTWLWNYNETKYCIIAIIRHKGLLFTGAATCTGEQIFLIMSRRNRLFQVMWRYRTRHLGCVTAHLILGLPAYARVGYSKHTPSVVSVGWYGSPAGSSSLPALAMITVEADGILCPYEAITLTRRGGWVRRLVVDGAGHIDSINSRCWNDS